MKTMTTIMNKRTYILLILLCLLVANTTTQAQVYSTANYRGVSSYRNTTAAEASFHNTPSFGSTSSMRIHSTAAQTIHSYGGSSSTEYPYNKSRSIIRTKATAITGGSLVDNIGYIAINPRKTVMNEETFTNTDSNGFEDTNNGNGYIDDDDNNTLPPPQFAPLHLDWDALLLILLMVLLYALRLYRQSPTTQP
jgi:hypothetical protein